MISEDERRDHIHLLAPIQVTGVLVSLEVEFHHATVDGTRYARSQWIEQEDGKEVLIAIRKLKDLVREHGKS